jgi:2-dehydropantoate 2-reductase
MQGADPRIAVSDPPMRIAVLGAGAMGSLFGGRLREGGADVVLLDVNQPHLDAINREGLRLVTDGRDRHIRLPALRPGQAPTPPDLLMVFTKSFQTADALAAVGPMLAAQTYVLTLQNGLGNCERLAAVVPEDRILIGMTDYPADYRRAGYVESHGDGVIRLRCADGVERPILGRITAAFTEAGMDCQVDLNVEAAIWQKVAFNTALNGICAVLGCTVGQIAAAPEGPMLASVCVDEVLTTAAALGIPVDRVATHAAVAHALAAHGGHKPSMLQDLLAGRRTEADAIHGEVIARARRLGLAVPVTETLYRLIRLAEMLPTRDRSSGLCGKPTQS